MNEKLCPCGSGRDFGLCCQPILAGLVPASNPEALMRSRYTAYVMHNIDYIMKSCTKEQAATTDREATKVWSEESEWLGLKIVKTEGGSAQDTRGTVEFIASYKSEGETIDHHELATFVKQEGKWLFADGQPVTQTIVRTQPKVGRNDPCPCGSGKKYKQCCGR